jgi:hypothetical protein
VTHKDLCVLSVVYGETGAGGRDDLMGDAWGDVVSELYPVTTVV